jgi:hypothetical protein
MMMVMMTIRKHMQAYGAAAKLALLLLIVTSLTVPVMLSSLPLAAADVVADCEKSGGKYVVKNGQGHCFVTIEPDCYKMPPGDVVPDPELCLKAVEISNDPTPSACTTTEGGSNTTVGRAPAVETQPPSPLIPGGGVLSPIEEETSTTEGDPVPGVPDTNSATTTSELRMQIEEACIAIQTGDTQGAMMNMDLALNALGSIGDNGTQVANITNTTTTTVGATNATNTTTTGTNAIQEVDPSINSTASELEGPGDPIKGIPIGVTETSTEEEAAGGGNNPSTATTTEPTTTTTTDGDDTGTTDTGGEGGSSDDVDRGDAD